MAIAFFAEVINPSSGFVRVGGHRSSTFHMFDNANGKSDVSFTLIRSSFQIKKHADEHKRSNSHNYKRGPVSHSPEILQYIALSLPGARLIQFERDVSRGPSGYRDDILHPPISA